MIYLLLSILFSTLTVSFFKIFERKGVHTNQAIVFNYLMCCLVGAGISGEVFPVQKVISSSWLPYAVLLGFLFILIFRLIAQTAQRVSVSASMVAAKLSVVIPVIVAWVAYHEPMGYAKAIGILCSLISVFLISRKNETTVSASGMKLFWLPFLVFTGSGIIDTLLNYLEQNFYPLTPQT